VFDLPEGQLDQSVMRVRDHARVGTVDLCCGEGKRGVDRGEADLVGRDPSRACRARRDVQSFCFPIELDDANRRRDRVGGISARGRHAGIEARDRAVASVRAARLSVLIP